MYWLADVSLTMRIWQSFVRRRHASIGIPGTDRNEPLWNDIVTKALLRYFFEKRKQASSFSSSVAKMALRGATLSAAKWGVEASPRCFSRRSGTARHQGHIVEPGGFSHRLRRAVPPNLAKVHPEYDSTVGATARFQRNYNGKQPGDPKRQLRRLSS